ncbi:MAG: DsrE/DsrF/DrsH-like family protein [Pseudomonadota bacterium]
MSANRASLAILVFGDQIDRVHYALVTASSAAAINQTVTLFFAGQAVRMLTRDGWHRLGPSSGGLNPSAFDQDAKNKGVADMETLIEACRELGVSFLCCEAAARLDGIAAEDLRPDLETRIVGATTFLGSAGATGRFLSF